MVVTSVYACTSDRQWRAMLVSNQTAHDNFIASERAFVSLKSGDLSVSQADGENITEWKVLFNWENTGSTPTYLLKVRTHCAFTDDFTFIDTPTNGTIPAKGEKEINSCTLNPATMLAIEQRRVSGFLMGDATYVDRFDSKLPSYETQFCYQVTGFEGAALNRRGLKINLIGCNKGHNCTDDECKAPEQKTERHTTLVYPP